MPEAKPQYGLPYQQLPATRVTPESTLNEQVQVGRQQIWDRFTSQWNEVNRSARFIGRTKAASMRQQLHIKAKQEMLQFNQKAQQQLAQLQNIDRLAQQGAIPNPDQIKARMMFGTDVAKSMYPEPEREPSIPKQFGELDVYSHRISQELERFKEDKPPRRLFKAISPLATAISIYRGPQRLKRKVRIWDFTTGDWRKTLATPEEIAEYDMWSQEKKDVAARKRELTGQLDISRRITQPGIGKSGFDVGVTESIPKPVTERRQQSKVIRQRNTRTGQIRESRDSGKTWQIVSG